MPMPVAEVEDLLSKRKKDVLLETLIARFEKIKGEAEVVVVQGLVATANRPYATSLNSDLAKALDAEVILVASPKNYSDQNRIGSPNKQKPPCK